MIVSALVSSVALAGEPMLGMFSSTKGFGLILETTDDRTFNQYTALIDMYAMFSSRTDIPGFRACFSHNYILFTKSCKDYDFELYLGPGCSAGYVHDYEKGRDLLQRNPGVMMALSLTCGCRMPFKSSRFCIDMSFMTEIGAHIRRNEELDITSMSLYINGLIRTPAPQLSILYRF